MDLIFDAHCHFNHGVPGDTIESAIYRTDLAFLREEHRSANIAACGMSSFSSVLSDERIYEENACTAEIAQTERWIYQWVVVDPRKPELYRQAEELLQLDKTLGIKIHSPCHGYPIAEYADELFAFASAHHATMLMHPDAIPEMPAFANKYPDMRLIIAHLGSTEHVDAIADAVHGNIYTDTSGNASSRNNVLEYAVGRIGSEKILFGTDTYASGFQVGRIQYARITQEDKRNIFYRNALRLFPQIKIIAEKMGI